MSTFIRNSVVTLSATGGTVIEWREAHRDVFFPRQEMEVDGEKKMCGGMDVAFPNYGKVDERWGLPPHGLLCDRKGVLHTPLGYRQSSLLEADDLWGANVSKQKCVVHALVEQWYNARGFDYDFFACLGEDADRSVYVGGGFRPYFNTPEGVARVRIGTNPSIEVHGARNAAGPGMRFPGSRQARVEIPGVGAVVRSRVVMERHGDLMTNNRYSCWIVRSDDPRYICVEPVLAPPEEYGAQGCAELIPGPGGIRLGCSFKFYPEGV